MDKNYAFSESIIYVNTIEYFINQIIHSFVFSLLFDESNKLSGLLLNSDKSKNSEVYLLPLENILKIILSISEGSMNSVVYERVTKDKKFSSHEPRKLVKATYVYDASFNLNNAIKESMRGKIYNRQIN